MPRALVLFSGGLDSCLASLILLRQGIQVRAVRFITPFRCSNFHDIDDFLRIVGDSDFSLVDVDIYNEFFEITKKPRFGYGKNMNPCIDCKILMLKISADMMSKVDADFIATGEVIGQRPMSQQRHIFNLMEKQTGLKGLILRPLSARLLPPTIPEQKGQVDRDKLYDIAGRGRSRQIELANEFGLKKYAAPSGGCLLTEPNYAFRLKELLNNNPNPTLNELETLRLGRHFRLPSGVKVIVGRDQNDNERLLSIRLDAFILEPLNVRGPVVLVIADNIQDNDLIDASTLCARYADAEDHDDVEVSVRSRQRDRLEERGIITVKPSQNRDLQRYMIKLTTVPQKILIMKEEGIKRNKQIMTPYKERLYGL